MQLSAQEIYDVYVRALVQSVSPDCHEYLRDGCWTPCATLALIEVVKRLLPGAKYAAKGHPDDWGRSEYFNLDVTAFPGNYGAPTLGAEHENAAKAERVLYDAWKLLSVDLETRILVAYFGSGTEFRSFDSLASRVETLVLSKQPGKTLVLVGGDFDARPAGREDLWSVYHHRQLGA